MSTHVFRAKGTRLSPFTVSFTLFALAALPSIAVAQSQPSTADTVRFLEQATFGPTPGLIQQVQQEGFEAFLQSQIGAPLTAYPELPPMPTMPTADCPPGVCRRDNYSMYPLQVHFFQNALSGSDQLRQRLAFALSQILVVSGRDVNLSGWMRPYQQLLYTHALGNYRELLVEVTRNPSMGRYLDVVNNRCQTRVPANPDVCRNGLAVKPNENYARELLQLFTIGVDLLNQDGSPILDGEGKPVPSYDQNAVEEFARVFTGYIFGPQFAPGIPNYHEPMRVRLDAAGREDYHDRGEKQLLNGVILPAGQTTKGDIFGALDNLVTHQNHAPFMSRLLIQHLVTSNPSPRYIKDVADVFAATVSSPQQLYEVARAILLHPEARGDVMSEVDYGRLREPVLFITGLLRMFNATSDGVLNTLTVAGSPMGSAELSQSVFNAPSVFNFYSPDYQIPGTDPPLLGPTFQIQTSVTALRRANLVNRLVFSNIPPAPPDRPGGTSIDLTPYVDLAGDPAKLVSTLDLLLLHGAMSERMREIVTAAVAAVPSSQSLLRVRQAVYLIASSSQYQVER
jgi:uncharacterized protein (DUF1800 family)